MNNPAEFQRNFNLRTAVCISGQARSVEENFSRINNSLILPNNADVFVHTWFDEADVGKHFCDPKTSSGTSPIRRQTAVLRENTEELIKKLYQPKLFQIDNAIQFVSKEIENMPSEDPRHPFRNRWCIKPHRTLPMFWSIHACNSLKRAYETANNKKYDAVIRIRFDLMMESVHKMSTYNLEHIYVLGRHTHTPYALQDTFAFSSSKNMDYYCQLFYEINQLGREGIEFCPEILLGAHLKKLGKRIIPLSNKTPPSYEVYR